VEGIDDCPLGLVPGVLAGVGEEAGEPSGFEHLLSGLARR
jgi:hypothetical protein